MRFILKRYLPCAVLIFALISSCAKKEVTKSDHIADLAPPAATADSASEGTEDIISQSVLEARDLVLHYFTPLNGQIKDVQNGVVKLTLEEEGPVNKGVRLSVFREGEPFYHPVTNELIGKAEEFVGKIELLEEESVDGLYLSRVINGNIRTGDVARLSSSRIKLAFFQDRKANWSISEAFYSSLKDSGRFLLVESYTPDYQPETLSKLSHDLGAEATLMFSTPVKDKKRILNAKLYWADDGDMFGEIEKETGDIVQVVAPDEEFITRTFRDSEPWRKYPIPGGQLIAMGDIDGNGTDEIAISDGRDIRIYNVQEDFREMWNIKAQGEGDHISLDILDLNNNGREEIFVTSSIDATIMTTDDSIDMDATMSDKDNFRVYSYVIEYDPAEGYKRITEDMPYFLRVSGKTLLMQRFHRSKIFAGPVYEGTWQDMHYKPEKSLELPDTVNIYGFTFVDWKDDGQIDLLTYGDHGHLYLYDYTGNLKWKSDESLGTFTSSFETRSGQVTGSLIKWSVRSRLGIVRTERGLEVIAVSRTPVLKRVPGLGSHKANVYTLWWDGSEMNKEVVLGNVSGAVNDFWIQGRELFLVAKRDLYTVVGNMARGDFQWGSILYYYNFAPVEANL
jgi:hypothetical protein